ncbi:MAG: flagellar motor protein MotB [Nocardioidaceae bacterium]
MSRRKRHEEHEEHVNHERWLVTYADMITLLMVLFIVMFAMSQVDEKKFNALKEGLAAGFGTTDAIMTGSKSIQEQPGLAAVAPVALDKQYADKAQQVAIEQAAADAVQKHESLQTQANYERASQEVDRLQGVQGKLLEALKKHGLADDVVTSIDERGLSISLVSRHVTFEANVATLTVRGAQVVDTLAPVLKEIDDPLQIDGHTNQVPVKPKYFATDWDLSSARAITVLRRLNEVDGIPASRMHAAAYGHEKPLVDPSEPGSQEINKRVDIIIQSALPPESQALLGQVVKDRARDANGGTTP